MSKKGRLRFFIGGVIGAVIGTAAGILLAPGPGAESRAKAADAMSDAWDTALDSYEQSARNVSDYIETVRPQIDAASDELRAKVDAARERMTQVRASLSETVMTSTTRTSGSGHAGAALQTKDTPASTENASSQAADTSIQEDDPLD